MVKYEFVLIPIGLVLLSFGLDLLAKKFSFVHPVLVQAVFWLGIVVLALLVVLKVAVWVKEFVKEMGK